MLSRSPAIDMPTGGGLGHVIAATLAAQRMHVVVADLKVKAAQRVAANIGGTAVTADLSTDEGADVVVAAVGESLDIV